MILLFSRNDISLDFRYTFVTRQIVLSQIYSGFDGLRIKIRTEFDPTKWNSIFVDVKAVVDESCCFKRYHYYLTRNLSGEGVTKLSICLDMMV